jgi:hypothetical protein
VNKVNNFQILQSEQNRPKVNRIQGQSEQTFLPKLPNFEKLNNQSEQTNVLVLCLESLARFELLCCSRRHFSEIIDKRLHPFLIKLVQFFTF